MKKHIWVIIVSAMCLLTFSTLWLTAHQPKRSTQKPGPPALQPASTHSLLTQSEITNWNTYSDQQYGFAIEYPADWHLGNMSFQPTQRSGIVLARKNDERDVYIEVTQDRGRLAYIRNGLPGNSVKFGGLSWATFLHVEENPGEFGDFRPTLALLTLHNDKYFVVRLTPNKTKNPSSEFMAILNKFRLTQK